MQLHIVEVYISKLKRIDQHGHSMSIHDQGRQKLILGKREPIFCVLVACELIVGNLFADATFYNYRSDEIGSFFFHSSLKPSFYRPSQPDFNVGNNI